MSEENKWAENVHTIASQASIVEDYNAIKAPILILERMI
jgi:hypothetical protein